MPKSETISVTVDAPIFDGAFLDHLSKKALHALYNNMATFIESYIADSDINVLVGSLPKRKIPVMFETHKINDEYGVFPYGVLTDIDMNCLEVDDE